MVRGSNFLIQPWGLEHVLDIHRRKGRDYCVHVHGDRISLFLRIKKKNNTPLAASRMALVNRKSGMDVSPCVPRADMWIFTHHLDENFYAPSKNRDSKHGRSVSRPERRSNDAASSGDRGSLLPCGGTTGPQISPVQKLHDRGDPHRPPGPQGLSSCRRFTQIRSTRAIVSTAVSKSHR